MRIGRLAVSVLGLALGAGCGAGAAGPEEVQDEVVEDTARGEASGAGVLPPEVGSPYFEFDAKWVGDGVEGRFTITYPGLTGQPKGNMSGPISCLYTQDNQALVIGQVETYNVEDPQSRWVVGDYLLIGILDQGDATVPGAAPDLGNFSPGFATRPACALHPAAMPFLTVSDGDFVVKDP